MIWDVHPESRIPDPDPDFFHPRSRIQIPGIRGKKAPALGYRIRIRKLLPYPFFPLAVAFFVAVLSLLPTLSCSILSSHYVSYISLSLLIKPYILPGPFFHALIMPPSPFLPPQACFLSQSRVHLTYFPHSQAYIFFPHRGHSSSPDRACISPISFLINLSYPFFPSHPWSFIKIFIS
jgi:hypothetical protein